MLLYGQPSVLRVDRPLVGFHRQVVRALPIEVKPLWNVAQGPASVTLV